MDRKQFLYNFWKWVFIPSIILVVAYFCIRFLVGAISENSFERFLAIGIVGIIAIMAIAQILGNFIKKMKGNIFSRLSVGARFYLKIVGKIFDYVAVLALGAMLYMFWTKDKWMVCFFVLILIIDRVRQILIQEKIKSTTTGS